MTYLGLRRAGLLGLWLAAGCASDLPAPGNDSGDSATTGAEPQVDPTDSEWWEMYQKIRQQAGDMDVDDFLAAYPEPAYVEQLSYDPGSAVGLDAILQAFPLAAAQQQLLTQNGFVAVPDALGATFETSYHKVYDADLPVLITSDSLLYALHRSFDAILMDLEQTALAEDVEFMLAELHQGLGQASIPENMSAAAADVDLYLTVARRLMTGTEVLSLGGTAIDDEADRIMVAVDGKQVLNIQLFGVSSAYDFSQLEPRGHYEDSELLRRYFQSMMWLGRTDVPMVTFDEAGTATRNRRAFEAAFLFDHLLRSTDALDRWTRIDRVLETLIGEPDSMNATDMAAFRDDAGLADLPTLSAMTDDEIFEPLMAKGYGLQRIMSQVMYTDPNDPLVKLPRVFQLMGQRFTLDSHVYNNVTYDRVQDLRTGQKVTRMLPDELDAQFVLGSNRAAALVKPQLDTYGYQGTLHEMRFIADTHPDDFWDASFYSGWLQALRTLNPTTQEWASYPEPMRTRAWADKTLNTQAASRAELRHDTLLYAKQSYSGGIGCEYPDAYVEPLPAFYERLAHLGALGGDMLSTLEQAGYDTTDAAAYFTNWTATLQTLRDISQAELTGQTLTGEQIAFLGQTIEQEIVGCGEVLYDGWYPKLFFSSDDVANPKPTIADVHTAPTDAAGNEKGWVLHTATGRPMLMVMTVPACDGSGATAYAGPISSQYSVLTENYTRMTDSAWAEQLQAAPPPRPEWTKSFAP